ncbi:hypothetical protein KPH14_008611 [Odynerus spinipes]|uniref:Cytochrome P450 n=1 Tax=Odynerus spinipes TaxID=1348599 RepID=A0AAD9RSE4_9HYME|nr:hypothetical protein KPH14_008611 [Odynerus spinipes]
MWFLVVCLALAVLVKIVIDRKQSEKAPPGPPGLPIIGNILDVKRLVKETKFHCLVWSRLAEIYGPVVRLQFGFADTYIIVSGRNAVIEMLARSEFDGRPDTLEIRLRTAGERRGVLFTDGELWSEHRRLTVKTLKRLGFDKTDMEDMVLDDAIVLVKTIEKWAEKGPISNMYEFVSVTVIASLWQLVTGSKLQLDQADSKLLETIKMLNTNMKESSEVGNMLNRFPFLRYFFPRLTGYARLKSRQDQIWQYFKEMIKEHKEIGIHDEPSNLIDVYLQEMQTRSSNTSSPSYFNEDNLTALIKDLFVAAVETTSSTIGFIIAYISVYQDIQRKLHDELDETLGKDILPEHPRNLGECIRNYDLLFSLPSLRLPYLQATLAEVTRMGNVASTSLPHRALSDTNFLGYHIKKNSILLANFMSVNMDEKHWGDPKTFRPERFINEKGEYVDDPWVMSFGSGRRRCLGEALAKNNLFLIMACMLQKFHFAIAPGHPEPCLMGINGFVIMPPPMTLLVTKRV